MGDPAFLLVEDDQALLRSLRRVLAKFGAVKTATTCAMGAKALADANAFLGFVIDIRLPDGNGLDLLETARRSHDRTPALVLTGFNDRRHINRAFELGAAYVCKPGMDLLRRFAEDAVAAPVTSPRDVVTAAIASYARTHGLTAAEKAMVMAAASGLSVHEYLDQRDITENTYRTQVRLLLQKTGAVSFSAIRDEILRMIAKA